MFEEGGRIRSRPGALLLQIGLEGAEHMPDALGKIRVLQANAQFVVRDFVQNRDGVVVEILPATRREFLENLLRFLVPGPPQVARETVQPDDHFG